MGGLGPKGDWGDDEEIREKVESLTDAERITKLKGIVGNLMGMVRLLLADKGLEN